MFFPDSKLVTSTMEAKYWVKTIKRPVPRLIVIHCAQSKETRASAENTARWFASLPDSGPKVSAHYCVDCDSIIQCVPERYIAYHSRGGDVNLCAIGVEMAGYASQTLDQWLDDYGLAMFSLARELLGDISQRNGIPLKPVTEHELRARTARGVTTHAMVTRAFDVRGGHSDPGAMFPMDRLLSVGRK
jgi:N-acetyl-anhydromuramyl-L-alanine amidase AmpD